MTKADKKRLDIIHRLPCLACVQQGVPQPSPTQAHHLVDKGYRKHSGGHQATIPLCAWHHVGEPVMDETATDMKVLFGPSMFHHGKLFTKVYGTQRELLARTNAVIK